LLPGLSGKNKRKEVKRMNSNDPCNNGVRAAEEAAEKAGFIPECYSLEPNKGFVTTFGLDPWGDRDSIRTYLIRLR
jgi:hypothetical protein